jgi:uncharacterized protein YbjT (DUF2867 family)
MPVLVHAAHRPLGRALARRLTEEGGQVRATASSGVALLRAEGVHTAACDPDDEGVLEAALTQVHTLVVMLGGLGVEDLRPLRAEGHAAARAARGADIERVVLVTVAGADVDAADDLRRSHGEVANAFAELPFPTVELRTGLVDTPALRDLLVTAGLPESARSRAVAPLDPQALIELIVAVDAARSSSDAGHLVLAAHGPHRRPLSSMLDGSAGAARLTGRRVPTAAAREALLARLDGPWWTDDAQIPDGWGLFGITPPGDGRVADTNGGEAASRR